MVNLVEGLRNQSTVDTVLNNADTANGLINKFVVSPVANLGLAGFVFDIPKETRVQFESDSTDHFTEDNSAIQDHIALKPFTITTGGFVAELKYEQEEPKTEIQELAEKLTTVNALIPTLTSAGRSARDAVVQAKADPLSLETLGAATNSGVDLFKAYQSLNTPDTEQAKAFNFFRALRDARQLVAIDTPWGFFNDLEIKSLIAIQNADTNSVTDFSVVLKEFRTARTQFIKPELATLQGRGNTQRAEQQDQGKAQGKSGVVQSILSRIPNPFN